MTSLGVSTHRTQQATPAPLRAEVDRVARRGRWLTTIGLGVLWLAAVVALLFAVAMLDAIAPMGTGVRTVLVALLVGVATFYGTECIRRLWRRPARDLAAAEQIDRAALAGDQPVVRGMSLRMNGCDDALGLALRERAEQRARRVADTVQPREAYPWARLRRQGEWLGIACLAWLIIGIVFPHQFSHLAARVAVPWQDTPPFSLTGLEPTWKPAEPTQGKDVTINVRPSGLQPDSVDFIRLNERGEPVERIPMTADSTGAFTHTLKRVREPIDFKLESHGRATQRYRITPTPIEQERDQDGTSLDGADEQSQDPGGTTQFDPDAVGESDDPNQAEAADLRREVESLIEDLDAALSKAKALDPSDAEALGALAKEIDELTSRGADLSDRLGALQAKLSPEAAGKLGDLQRALGNMRSTQSSANPPKDADPSDPESQSDNADWLDNATDAAEQDIDNLRKGLGSADLPTDSGAVEIDPQRQPGDAPEAGTSTGVYDIQGNEGNTGPLPDAVMQQVPPSYRPLIRAYFSSQNEPGDTP